MKFVFAVLFLSVSFCLTAASESRSIVYNGSQDSFDVLLRGEETHTEYRVEQRRATCSRSVYAGTRTVCSGGRPRSCRSYPVYRTQYYTCWQSVRIPYEVKDFDVNANIKLLVSKKDLAQTRGETFKLSLKGDNVHLEAVGSRKYLLVLRKNQNRVEVRGSFKFVSHLYAVELVEAAPIVNSLQMSNISIENNVLSTVMGSQMEHNQIAFSLKVSQIHTFGSDPVLFDRELTSDELSFRTLAQMVVLDLQVDRLAINLNNGKFALTTSAFFKDNKRLLNASQFNPLEVSRKLIYTNR